MVIGPGRAVLFYGRHSLGEGLKVDKVRDAAFLLTGAGTWVGKSAYLTAKPTTISEGKRAITQAVSNNKGERTRVSLCEYASPTALPVQYPENISSKKLCLEIVILTIPKCPDSPPEAENATGDGETKGFNYLGFLCLQWTVGLRVTEAHCQ